MKKVTTLFLLFFFIVIISCDHSLDQSKTQALELVKLEIPVDGMTCEGCENTLNADLLKLDGVEKVEASHTNKVVELMVDTNVTKKSELESRINRLGYQIIK